MKLGEKINFLRTQQKLTMQQLADKSNLSKGYISMLEKGINPQTKKEIIPSLETVQYIANAFNVSLETLLENVDSDVELIKHNKIEEQTSQSKGIKIPVLGEVAAGVPISAIEDILDYEEISEDMARTGEFFGLRIKGDSMQPKMDDGDVVIVKQQSDVDSGDIAIVLVNGDSATCKKIQKHDNGLMLISTNPNYPPRFFSKDEVQELPVRILGKVVELRAKF